MPIRNIYARYPYIREDTLWHGAYRRWFDHREDGNRIRAAVWGWIADRIVR